MIESCVFCGLLKKDKYLLYKDETLFAFHDIKKASAVEHILVCPTEHILDVSALTEIHLDLVIKMKKLGQTLVETLKEKSEYRYKVLLSKF